MDKKNVTELIDSQFDGFIGQHPLVLVDFWAPWCAPCLKLAPVLEELALIYAQKIVIAKIDISSNSQVPNRYAISTIPTMVLFKSGKELERLVGNLPIIQIQQALDKYLP